MASRFWWDHIVCDPIVHKDGSVWIWGADDDRTPLMRCHGLDAIDSIQRLIKFCDYGLEHHRSKNP